MSSALAKQRNDGVMQQKIHPVDKGDGFFVSGNFHIDTIKIQDAGKNRTVFL